MGEKGVLHNRKPFPPIRIAQGKKENADFAKVRSQTKRRGGRGYASVTSSKTTKNSHLTHIPLGQRQRGRFESLTSMVAASSGANEGGANEVGADEGGANEGGADVVCVTLV
jgi:hypothetical protein